MSKALIFSDIHIHPHKRSTERLNDCLEVLEWVFQTAKEREIETIIFAGDLFHDRQKIDVLTYQRTFDIFKKHFAPPYPFNLYLLLGNHDLWHAQKLDVSSVFPLASLPNVTVINEPSVHDIEIGDKVYPVGFLPYTHDPIKDLARIKNNRGVLFGHVAVDDATFNVRYGIKSEVAVEHDGDMVKVGFGIFKDWDRVFLGHYHAEQKLSNNIEYIGSPLQLSFGEAFEKKHIIVYDFDTGEKEYIVNDFSPIHLIIKEEEICKHTLNNNFVKVIVDDVSATDLIDTQKRLIDTHNPQSIEIVPNITRQDHVIEDAKSILFKEDEMLEQYVKQVNPELDHDLLLKIGKEIMESVE